MKKKIFKYTTLLLLILFSYTFTATSVISFTTNVKPTMIFHPPEGFYSYRFYRELHTEFLHWVGFFILSMIYGWVIMIIAILDEVMQFFIPGRVMDFMDIARNMGASGIGLLLRWFLFTKHKGGA